FSSTHQSNLICSSQPIVALAGDDVVLPCRLDPPTTATFRAVEWTRPGLDPEYVHVHQDGRLAYQGQNPQFKYRTTLFVDQLINGNVSLKLLRVKVSDAGKYRCFIPSLWKEAFIQVTVGAVSSPIISLMRTDSGVVLQCESSGWYPEPEVLWLDGEGKLLSAGPTETVRGPDDLYTVSSRVTVEKRHSNSFTCRVHQKDTNHTTETHFQPSADHFEASSRSAVPIGVLVAVLFIVIIAAAFAVWKRRRNQTKERLLKVVRERKEAAEKQKEKLDEQLKKRKKQQDENQSKLLSEREEA
ncbi:butyrophilin subfamily 1 member A1-like, partial [Centropristis striata]|uniref:butyrophilin subfamily 1 member A1-like n=1 Tax=Centropristis striata TaxID=184440 RepID=UPI0027E1C0EA